MHRALWLTLAIFGFMFLVTSGFAVVAIVGQRDINQNEWDVRHNQAAIAAAREADAAHLGEVCRRLLVVQANQQVVLNSLRNIRDDLTTDRSVPPSVRRSLAHDFGGVEEALRRVDLVPC